MKYRPNTDQSLAEYMLRMTASEKRAFAHDCGTKVRYMRNLAKGLQPPSFELAQIIYEESEGMVTLDSWMHITEWRADKDREQLRRA